jgi:hypothetical protein
VLEVSLELRVTHGDRAVFGGVPSPPHPVEILQGFRIGMSAKGFLGIDDHSNVRTGAIRLAL